MTRRRVEPLVWLLFSGGGVVAAVLLPVLVLVLGLLVPLGVVTPDHARLHAVAGHPVTVVLLLGSFVLLLVHGAHRFRYILYDGLQLRRFRTPIAVLCYGGAVLGIAAAAVVLAGIIR